MRTRGLSITRRREEDPWTARSEPDATVGGCLRSVGKCAAPELLVCLPAPVRDFQPDPPVYILSNRIRFGRQKMSAECAFCGMRIDQRGAVARKSPGRAGVAQECQRTWRGWTSSCHQDGVRRPSAELAVGSRPPCGPPSTQIVKGIGGLTIDVDGAAAQHLYIDPTWRNSTLPTSFSAVSL
jgi:hypothetical protein